MAINFSVGDVLVVNRAFVGQTLANLPPTPYLTQTLSSLGSLLGTTVSVLATGSIFSGGITLSFIRVLPPTNHSLYRRGKGVINYFASDSLLNNSFELSTASLDDQLYRSCHNNSGATISKGNIVRHTGYDSITQRPTIALSSALSLTTSMVLGIATQDIVDGSNGTILIEGSFQPMDTVGGNIGDPIYVSNTAGAVSLTPGTENSVVGRILAVGTTGAVYVRGELVPGTGISSSIGGGWTDAGTIVRLTTVTDQVGIGTATPAVNTKLQVVGDATNRNVILTAGDQGGAGTGGSIALAGGIGGSTGSGGPITLTGGLGGTTSGSASGVTIQGGLATDGNGGGVTVRGEHAATTTSTNRNGGDATVTGGNAVRSGRAGAVTITGGNRVNGPPVGGEVFIIAGFGTGTANGAPINIISGQSADGIAGEVAIIGGNTQGTTTSIAAASSGFTLPQPTINVVSTAGFPVAGTMLVGTSLGLQTVTYTGVTATSFTGCAGGAGLMLTGGGVFGLANTSPGGAIRLVAGSGGFGGGPGGNTTVRAGRGRAVGTGGTLTLEGGGGELVTGTGTGGTAILGGGPGGAVSGNGGSVTIRGGLPVSGTGGAITITGRNGVGSNNAGGAVTITAGASAGTSAGAAASLVAGAGGPTGGVGGDITITAGAGGATSGTSGSVTVGSGTTTNGNTGQVTISSAPATGTDRSTGNISLTCGLPTGTGTRGNIVTTGNLTTATVGAYDIGGASLGWKRLYLDSAINTTTGVSATINKAAGRFRKDTTGTTFTLTNSYITANSIVMLTFVNLDATTTAMAVVAAAGSAIISFNAAPTANLDVNFLVINTD